MKYLLSTAAILGILTSISLPANATLYERVEVKLMDDRGLHKGNLRLIQAPQGVLVHLKVWGQTSGAHGLHFHKIGNCDPKTSFKSAGGHIMPQGKPHGYLNPKGPHAGNLPNIYVGKDGRGEAEFFTTMLSLKGNGGKPKLLDEDGSAIVFHTNSDDHLSQPIGGSGGRELCGVIK